MTKILVYVGPLQTTPITDENGTDISSRLRLVRGAVTNVYDPNDGGPSIDMGKDLNWAIIDITDLPYKKALRLVSGPDYASIDRLGPRLRHFWCVDLAALPLQIRKKIEANTEILTTVAKIKIYIRHRETNLTLDMA